MNDFNEIQQIWNLATSDGNTTSESYTPDSLIQKLKKLERVQSRMNRIKVLVLVLLLGTIIFSLSTLPEVTYPVYIGFGIITLAVMGFMTYYLKNQFTIKRLDFSLDSLTFVGRAIEMLERQNSIFKAPFRVFALVLIAGANIMLLGLEIDINDRFSLHTKITFMILVSTLVGIQIRNWRTKREVNPLITELNAYKEGLIKD